jgi:AcrR family transcriptional regulator
VIRDRGALARDQLIAHAARIFSSKGYAAASTREICEAAGVNLASIHYYFGDQEGLYRAVLLLPIKEMTTAFGGFDDPALSFEDALRMLFAPFMSHEERADLLDTHLKRLHLREMTEPSPVFREIVKVTIAPVHESICRVLARHCHDHGGIVPDRSAVTEHLGRAYLAGKKAEQLHQPLADPQIKLERIDVVRQCRGCGIEEHDQLRNRVLGHDWIGRIHGQVELVAEPADRLLGAQEIAVDLASDLRLARPRLGHRRHVRTRRQLADRARQCVMP